MELNGVNSSTYAGAYAATTTQTSTVDTVEAASVEEAAAVYEKSEQLTSATYNTNPKVDQNLIDKLKADAEARYSQLASLVEKLMTKQGEKFQTASLSDLMKGVVSGEIEVDPETVEQAKKDVADDGYWGVEQTAERIVSFAKALTGGDASKAEEMRAAIEKGFGSAKELWGDDLPEISQKTYDRVNEMMDDWIAEATTTTA